MNQQQSPQSCLQKLEASPENTQREEESHTLACRDDTSDDKLAAGGVTATESSTNCPNTYSDPQDHRSPEQASSHHDAESEKAYTRDIIGWTDDTRK
jgi:hypothetical protein